MQAYFSFSYQKQSIYVIINDFNSYGNQFPKKGRIALGIKNNPIDAIIH